MSTAVGHRLLVRTALIVGCVAAVAGCDDGMRSAQECRTPFDRRGWAATGGQEDGTPPGGQAEVRRELAQQLIECRRLLGRTRRQAQAMLGRPYDRVFGRSRDGQDRWIIGTPVFGSVNVETLIVGYRRGRVSPWSSVRTEQDDPRGRLRAFHSAGGVYEIVVPTCTTTSYPPVRRRRTTLLPAGRLSSPVEPVAPEVRTRRMGDQHLHASSADTTRRC